MLVLCRQLDVMEGSDQVVDSAQGDCVDGSAGLLQSVICRCVV